MKRLAGVMFWTIDLDDFSGRFCNQGKYPLINAVRDEILNAPEISDDEPETSANDNDNDDKLYVCYYTNWSQYRPAGGTFLPYDIDPNLCTHIIFAFAKVVGETIQPYEWNDPDTEWTKGKFLSFIHELH